MKNIVACIDFSDTTSAILEIASALATSMRTKLYLLNIPVIEVNAIGYDKWMVAADLTDCIDQSRRALEELRDSLVAHGVDAEAVTVENSDSSIYAIVDEVRRLEAGLVIAGSHGHGALYRLILGSTTQGLLRHAQCPVLIVPAQRSVEHETTNAGALKIAK